jgi:hypothetical protein
MILARFPGPALVSAGLAWLAALAPGCTATGADDVRTDGPNLQGPLSLELGTGLTTHAPLAAGDDVELIMGPQGGWHLEFTAQACGQAAEGLALRYRLLPLDGGMPLNEPSVSELTSRRVVAVDGGCFQRVGDRAVLRIQSPAEVVGTHWVAEVEATRGEALQAVSRARIRVVDITP